MNLLPDVVRDYIALDEDAYSDKYPDHDYIEVMEEVDNVTFESSHVTSEHFDAINDILETGGDITAVKQSIQSELSNKELSNSFIETYLEEAQKGQKKLDRELRPLKDALKSFKYKGKPLNLEELRDTLNKKELMFDGTRVAALIVESASKRIRLDARGEEHADSKLFERYMSGLNSLLDKIQEPTKSVSEAVIDIDNIFGYSNPKITDRRESIYREWEEVYKEYDNLKKAIKKVLDAWDKLEGETLSFDTEGKERWDKSTQADDDYFPHKRRRFSPKKDLDGNEVKRIIEDLDDEFDALAELYNKMDKYNYVLRLKPFNVGVTSTRESDIDRNALGFLLDYLSKLVGEKSQVQIAEDEIEVDIEREEPYLEGYEYDDPEKGKVSSVDYEAAEVTPMEEELARVRELGGMSRMLEEVDPLFAIVLDSEVDELGSYTTETHPKMLKKLKEIQIALESSNPNYKKQLDKLMDRMEEIANYAALPITKEDEYYLPMGDTLLKYMDNHQGDASLFGKEELVKRDDLVKFHQDLLKVIGDIIESPTDKSILPLFIGEAETVSGKVGSQITSQDRNVSSIIHEFTSGSEAPKRDWKNLTTEISDLVDVVFKYYIEPSEGDFYPFAKPLEFLRPAYLTEIHLKGPDSPIKTLRRMNLSRAWASIKPKDLRNINAWLTIAQKKLTDPQEMINLSENVIKSLNNLLKEQSHNDKYYFAWKVKQLIDNNDDLESTDYELMGDSIVNLANQYGKKKPSLWNLMKYLNGAKDELLNNHLLKPDMNEYLSLTENRISEILYSTMNNKILIAHDEIRKMSNKPTYYAHCRLNDYDTMQDTIEIIKSKYNVEVNANDIVGIVNEFDSMESLGKKYGLNENTIYHIKALYR